MRRDAYEIISETNQIVKDIRDNKSRHANENEILNVIAKYPVPEITPKQLFIMYNRKYSLNYMSAVSGLKVEEIQKKVNGYIDKHR